jgi:hypothetical protein
MLARGKLYAIMTRHVPLCWGIREILPFVKQLRLPKTSIGAVNPALQRGGFGPWQILHEKIRARRFVRRIIQRNRNHWHDEHSMNGNGPNRPIDSKFRATSVRP